MCQHISELRYGQKSQCACVSTDLHNLITCSMKNWIIYSLPSQCYGGKRERDHVDTDMTSDQEQSFLSLYLLSACQLVDRIIKLFTQELRAAAATAAAAAEEAKKNGFLTLHQTGHKLTNFSQRHSDNKPHYLQLHLLIPLFIGHLWPVVYDPAGSSVLFLTKQLNSSSLLRNSLFITKYLLVLRHTDR